MKLSARAAPGYFAKPDPASAGLLLYGSDAMRIALKRQQMLAALLGPEAEAEMRLTRMQAAELRRDPAQLLDAVKATGFFPGPRAVLVEEANDNATAAVAAALEDWKPGDAQIVVAAGALKAASKLRKLFEGHPSAYAAGIYDDPPDRAEIERLLAAAGLRDIPSDAMSALTALAATLSPGDFAQTLEKIALYKHGDATPLSPAEIETCAPLSHEAALDDVLNVVAEAKAAEIGPLLRRLQAQGTNATGLCIGATRHFRTLYTIAADSGGPASGIGKLRPPVFGPRRDRLLRQAQGWRPDRLERALSLLTETDLQLRAAGRTAPAMALMERTLIRLAMMGAPR
ncbi:DNA polymerase III subunit delta [Pseudooceanicola lipolyticus]|uniref:DNA-directed DNA polymerase n=1 Tax=Pseudooceanicola lipolyticus TaxID=2029104 RepID=A0A2M8IZE3_9RHOB|nr:DNA polymerase III subunit delta [Pseudooceanicola lipolyticus]PJE35878.1 DNA polymerase III subunit delta [Pseudooceanicola lipolyticus]